MELLQAKTVHDSGILQIKQSIENKRNALKALFKLNENRIMYNEEGIEIKLPTIKNRKFIIIATELRK